jgi:tRNA modification GTPase
MHRSVGGGPRETSSGVAEEARGLTAGDTIAAISTPAGEGAIALIRISGPEAIDVADRIFCGNKKPAALSSHVQQFGSIRDAGSLIDEVMISVHRAPSSYTGEDLVEITCHGGVLVSARVLETCLHAGARAARAGEFTERAFLNGKMDLALG